jgi:hypothetical protein
LAALTALGRDAGTSATAARTARKLRAFTEKTAVGPNAASRNPDAAGPRKRASWSERLLTATALSRSSGGTVEASIPWKAGKLRVPRLPPTTAMTLRRGMVRVSVAQSVASRAATAMFAP